MAHAILSASGAHRWLNCTPSARIEQKFKDETSIYAEEGTKAHAVAEEALNHYLTTGEIRIKCEDEEMREAVASYVDICIEKINEARRASIDAKVFVEARLDFSHIVPKGFGTGDLVMISDSYLEVVDLKYGKGVEVSAVNNPQMRLYALGLYNSYGWMYGADTIRMTIVQPRINNISTDEVTPKELILWGDKVKQVAKIAWEGEGELKAGDHCKFCKARRTCRARTNYMQNLIRNKFKEGNEIEPFEVSEILLNAKKIKNWLTDLEEWALQEALKGTKWPWMKLVEGRSNRKIRDEQVAVTALSEAGYQSEDLYESKLKGFTKLEKLCGKKELATLLSGNIIKSQGKPTLVSEDDKRPEYVKKLDFDTDTLEEEL